MIVRPSARARRWPDAGADHRESAEKIKFITYESVDDVIEEPRSLCFACQWQHGNRCKWHSTYEGIIGTPSRLPRYCTLTLHRSQIPQCMPLFSKCTIAVGLFSFWTGQKTFVENWRERETGRSISYHHLPPLSILYDELYIIIYIVWMGKTN